MFQISLNDERFPKAICYECEDNLNKFYCFRKVIINSDKELKERVNTVKEETVICKTEDLYLDENDNDQNDNTFDEDDCDDPEFDSVNGEKKLSKYPKTCPECNVTFLTSTELWKHKRKNHVKPGVCNICGVIVRADNLKKHVKIHFQGTVACKICHKKYKNAESLRSHLLIHKGLEFKCDICGKVSSVKSEHARHVKSHEGNINSCSQKLSVIKKIGIMHGFNVACKGFSIG